MSENMILYASESELFAQKLVTLWLINKLLNFANEVKLYNPTY